MALSIHLGFSGGSAVKESACQCRRHRFDPWVGKIPWRREWQPTPVFLPWTEEPGRLYSSWGRKRVGHDFVTKQQHTFIDWLIYDCATAAKSLQSCPTLCHPIDSSPPGSSVPGILQARTLEWVAISFSIWLCSTWYLSCLVRYRTVILTLEVWSLNPWTTREVLDLYFLIIKWGISLRDVSHLYR